MSPLALRAGRAIGIDLGGEAIAAVQLAGDGRSVSSRLLCPRRLPFGRSIEELPRLLRAMERHGFRAGPVVAALPDDRGVVAELSLPVDAKPAVLRELVGAHLGRVRSLEPEALVCAWWTTDRGSRGAEGAGSTRRSLAVALPIEDAESMASICEAHSVDLAAIEPRPLALARVAGDRTLGPLELLVDRSGQRDSATVATVIEHGRVTYVRPILAGAGSSAGRDALLRELRLTVGYLAHRHPNASLERILGTTDPEDADALADAIPDAIGLPFEPLTMSSLESGLDGRLVAAYGLARSPEARR